MTIKNIYQAPPINHTHLHSDKIATNTVPRSQETQNTHHHSYTFRGHLNNLIETQFGDPNVNHMFNPTTAHSAITVLEQLYPSKNTTTKLGKFISPIPSENKNNLIEHSEMMRALHPSVIYKSSLNIVHNINTPFTSEQDDRLRSLGVDSVQSCDFQNRQNVKEVQANLNAQVSKVTDGQINQTPLSLVSQPPDTDFLLGITSSVYFYAKWDDPFDPEQTKPEPFLVNGTHVEQVDMMHNNDTGLMINDNFGKHGLCVFIRTFENEANKRCKMLYALPKTKQTPEEYVESQKELLETLNAEGMAGLNLSYTEVDLYLPKFEIRYDTRVDIPGIEELSPGSVGRIDMAQSVWLKHDEDGSGMAAVLSGVLTDHPSSVEQLLVKPENPFNMYLLAPDQSPLLSARVADPRSL